MTVNQRSVISGGRFAWRVAASIGLDLSWGLRNLLVNIVASSFLTPRVLRYVLYRLAGMHVETPGIMHSCVFEGKSVNVSIGDRSFVNTHCYLEAVAPIRIGRECALGMQVLVVTSGHELEGDGRWSAVRNARPVTLGDHVWVGARAVILPGVTVGDHCVIASGAVVTRDCAPWGLYAGVPARRVRDLAPGADRAPGDGAGDGGGGA